MSNARRINYLANGKWHDSETGKYLNMKLKKSIALIISLVMVITSLVSLVTAATQVTDPEGHWA